MQIDLAEGARCLAELGRVAQRREPVMITTPGGLAPVSTPVDPPPEPTVGALRGTVQMSEDFDAPLDDFAEYER